MTVPRAGDVYQIITDRILAHLERGTVPWHKPWSRGADGAVQLPTNLVSKKAYRGVNVFLLGVSAFSSPYWVSFKQALDLGGNVRKGEKGTPCVFWKVEKNEEGATDANGHLLAAAPDLLATLAAIVDATNDKYQFHGDKPMSFAGPEWKRCIIAAREAIAKAKGTP